MSGEQRVQHTLTETCRCGASITVTTARLADASRQLEPWRERHAACLTPRATGFRTPAPPDPIGWGVTTR